MDQFTSELLKLDSGWSGEPTLDPAKVGASHCVRPSVLVNIFEYITIGEVFTVRSLINKLSVVQHYDIKTQTMFIHSTLLAAIRSNHPDVSRLTPSKYILNE